MGVDTAASANLTSIVHNIRMVTSSKDSIHIQWDISDEYAPNIQGYRIKYQAVGSTIVQHTHRLERQLVNYDILQLHEDTYYNICISVIHNLTDNVDMPCIKATTHVDSLSVALGSTFGAFLCLAIIVFFVFLAKWNHTRKLRKNLQAVGQTSETYDSMGHQDGEFEMSDVSLHVHEGTTTQADGSSQSSQFSGQDKPQANGIDYMCDGEISDVQNHNTIKPPPGTMMYVDVPTSTIVDTSDDPPIMIEPPPFSRKTKRSSSLAHGGARPKTKPMLRGIAKQLSMDHNLPPRDARHEPIHESIRERHPEDEDTPTEKKDYGGGRPKEFSALDPRSMYANKTYMDITNQQVPLRPNLSCNW